MVKKALFLAIQIEKTSFFKQHAQQKDKNPHLQDKIKGDNSIALPNQYVNDWNNHITMVHNIHSIDKSSTSRIS